MDEALRLNSPVPVIFRYILEDVDYEGIRLPAGSVALLHWNAGNRDPAVHQNPNQYDISRPPRPLTTFGAGVQICPGRNIARTLAVVGVKALCNPEVSIRREGPIEWQADTPIVPRPYATRLPVTIETVNPD